MAASPHINLDGLLKKTGCHCLNEKPGHGLASALSGAGFLESDSDEQLLITVEFESPVKLYAIQIVPTEAAGRAPRTIKTFVNQALSGFDAAESVEPAETLTLSKADYEGAAAKHGVRLRFVRYQNVQTLRLFVEGNLGDEETTQVQRLHFIGTPIDATKDLKELKKASDDGALPLPGSKDLAS